MDPEFLEFLNFLKLVFFIFAICGVSYYVYLVVLFNTFCKKYKVELNHNKKFVHIHRHYDSNYYELKYPHWLYSNKDGTKNKVRVGNQMIFEKSVLILDNYEVTCDNPIIMLALVNSIRRENKNVNIPFSKEEIEKKQMLLKEKRLARNTRSIQGIVNQFELNPTDFEKYIAKLYEKMGYVTHVTSATNDGGFDIKMTNKDKLYIVECKCFNIFNTVSRPLIQKLVGANQVEFADEMIFITTSDFSKEAIEYAKLTHVKLINGQELMKMINDINKDNYEEDELDLEVELTPEDIKKYFPKDTNLIIDGNNFTYEI